MLRLYFFEVKKTYSYYNHSKIPNFCSYDTITQEIYWNEQKIQLKYSYAKSFLTKKNPEQLGENLLQNILKDYNGQTYWISVDIYSFLKQVVAKLY